VKVSNVRVALVLGLCLLASSVGTSPAFAADTCARPIEYVFGFADLHRFLGPIMGEALTCETADPNGTGDVHQQTNGGLAFWRRSTNTPTFTNGSDHWAHTDKGWLCWTGGSIDPPSDAGPCAATLLASVQVADPVNGLAPFDRTSWHVWIDVDHDCQDTRAEVLIQESRVPVMFRSGGQCTVTSGMWTSPYTGANITSAASLDIDHLVPLANVYRSGGSTWDDAQRSRYANDLDDPEQLVAVELGLNRSKGDSGPEAWRPPNPATWCAYAQAWLRVKERWHLTVTPAERSSLSDMLAMC
jgi:Protein of unknown function (DUF1524)